MLDIRKELNVAEGFLALTSLSKQVKLRECDKEKYCTVSQGAPCLSHYFYFLITFTVKLVKPAMFQFSFISGSSDSVVVIPYVICGVVLELYILTVAVNVYKFRR